MLDGFRKGQRLDEQDVGGLVSRLKTTESVYAVNVVITRAVKPQKLWA